MTSAGQHLNDINATIAGAVRAAPPATSMGDEAPRDRVLVSKQVWELLEQAIRGQDQREKAKRMAKAERSGKGSGGRTRGKAMDVSPLVGNIMLDDGDPDWVDEDAGHARSKKKRKTDRLETLEAMVKQLSGMVPGTTNSQPRHLFASRGKPDLRPSGGMGMCGSTASA
ncbi:hypothetical protein FA13DRAFT_1736064 [Coprinellus micaceus]|uniref:Uncharacterized protein n=1 Tax=Coprinellus micaceus TaxID=71717 RepID=A0A4Y7T144_COPMI|nr:hypothetical protein FA13DRAFT_1736064 [Coprinellus micaceus]